MQYFSNLSCAGFLLLVSLLFTSRKMSNEMLNLYLILKYEDFFVTWGPRLLSWLHRNILNGWGKIKKITIFIKHIQDWLLILLFTACLQRSPTNWVLSLTPLPVVLPSWHLHCEKSLHQLHPYPQKLILIQNLSLFTKRYICQVGFIQLRKNPWCPRTAVSRAHRHISTCSPT